MMIVDTRVRQTMRLFRLSPGARFSLASQCLSALRLARRCLLPPGGTRAEAAYDPAGVEMPVGTPPLPGREEPGAAARRRGAAFRDVTLNERLLRRINTDLHRGPIQHLGLALLLLDRLANDAGTTDTAEALQRIRELRTVEGSLHQAIQQVRAIAAELRLPGLENLSPGEVIGRVVACYERETGRSVVVWAERLPAQVPLAANILLFRLLRASLAMAHHLGRGEGERIAVQGGDEYLHVDVSYPGSAPRLVEGNGDEEHLDLVVLGARIQSLGGDLSVETTGDSRIRILARLPLRVA